MKKCIECNSIAVEDRSRCAKHLKRAREYARERNKERKAAHLCVACSNSTHGSTYCPECNKKHALAARKYYAERRSSGLCTECGTPVSGQYMCDDCLIRYRAYRRNGIKSKLYQSIKERDGWKCRLCGKERALSIHHIDGQGERDSENLRQIPNNDPSNLISLCRGCHSSLTKFSHSIDRPLVIRLINSVTQVEP